MNVRRIKVFEDSKDNETYINLVRTLEIFECVLLSSKIEPVIKYYPAIWRLLNNLRWNPDLASLLKKCISRQGFLMVTVRQFAVLRVFGIAKVNTNGLKLQVYPLFTRIRSMANRLWFCKVHCCVLSHFVTIIALCNTSCRPLPNNWIVAVCNNKLPHLINHCAAICPAAGQRLKYTKYPAVKNFQTFH